jgi:hypothetical protein
LRGELSVIVPRRLRAPVQDGAIVAEPPLSEVRTLLRENRQRLSFPAAPLLGRSWADLRRQARQLAVSAARDYLRQSGEPVSDWGDTSLLMAGHQPDLSHPGVWVKNFALNGLARAYQATPINLVVDNDTAKSTALRLPALATADAGRGLMHSGSPHVVQIPFDHYSGEVPYEERPVRDETLFSTLQEHAAPLVNAWGFVPLLAEFWAEASREVRRTPLLGERLVAARRSIERKWGCCNLELPVSRLCRTEPFAWFACHLLAELPRFHATYNDCVHEYRRVYGIRSRSHPVPDLAADGDWLEAPFWGWRAGSTAGETHRGRLLARWGENQIELRIGNEPWPALPSAHAGDPARAIQAWRELERRGLKVRSRALTNTLFARLFLADLFVHGIGGGKYDELTDEIIRRFYGVEPPGFLVLSATLLLPFKVPQTRPETCNLLRHELRDLYYNPERHLANGARVPSRVKELTAQKQAWITRQPANAHERRERFHALRAVAEKLRPEVAQRVNAAQEELNECEKQLQGKAVLERRDYAFCLYPETTLRPFCTRFLSHAEPTR